MAKNQAPSQTVVLDQKDEKKGSIKYFTKDEKAVVSNIYLDRSFSDPMPEKVKITVEAA